VNRVGGAVAGGGHQDSAAVVGILNHVSQERGGHDIAEAHVDHPGPVVHRVDDGRGDVIFFEETPARAGAQIHHSAAVSESRHPDAIIGPGADDPRHRRPVAILIHRVVVGVEIVTAIGEVRRIGEIPPPEVIDEAIAVIVEAIEVRGIHASVVIGILAGIDPQVLPKLFVVIVDARVDDGNENVGRAALDIPGLLGLNLR